MTTPESNDILKEQDNLKESYLPIYEEEVAGFEKRLSAYGKEMEIVNELRFDDHIINHILISTGIHSYHAAFLLLI